MVRVFDVADRREKDRLPRKNENVEIESSRRVPDRNEYGDSEVMRERYVIWGRLVFTFRFNFFVFRKQIQNIHRHTVGGQRKRSRFHRR
jgi:hypothetical protein